MDYVLVNFIVAASIVLIPIILICGNFIFRKLKGSVFKRLLITCGIILGLCLVYLLVNALAGILIKNL